MKFSIIIPVYNAEKYLSECVESLLQQSYQEMEILLVDDGSTDESGNICDQFAAHYSEQVRVFHQNNQGQLMARSCGIENATGEVFLFVDSDDCLRSDTLELLNKQFAKTQCDMILFNASQDEAYCTSYPGFEFENEQIFSGEKKKKLYEMIITTSKLNPLWLKAVRKECAVIIDTEYKYFNLKNAGDLLYSIPMLSAAKTIVYLNQNLYYYRSRPGSIVHSYNPLRHRSIKRVHQEIEKYIDEWGMEAYHPLHHAREVRGWVDCLKQLLSNAAHPDRQILHELAEDEYFRNAYRQMDAAALSRETAMLAKCLYTRKYGFLLLAGKSLRAYKKIKNH